LLGGLGGDPSESPADDLQGLDLRVVPRLLLGALAAGANDDERARLARYGAAIGLAFQIVDDILDVTADTATLGKTQGADVERNKPTYPALLGLDGARDHAAAMRDEAIDALDGDDDRFEPLRALARFVVERSW
jgi:geranylgeranyl pyrophosphate synthase